MKTGYMFLVAIIDWYSRYIISWDISNSLDNWFCIEALIIYSLRDSGEH
jgi:putative transposase